MQCIFSQHNFFLLGFARWDSEKWCASTNHTRHLPTSVEGTGWHGHICQSDNTHRLRHYTLSCWCWLVGHRHLDTSSIKSSSMRFFFILDILFCENVWWMLPSRLREMNCSSSTCIYNRTHSQSTPLRLKISLVYTLPIILVPLANLIRSQLGHFVSYCPES